MASIYLIQIVDRDSGRIISDEPGGPLEAELVSELSRRLLEQPVGIFTTRAKVVEAVVASLRDVIHNLKRRV